MRFFRAVTPCAALLFACGCHSAFIEADVVNKTAAPIPLVEVEYPSASFGTQDLAPGGVYHYRFKVLGSGAAKVLWTDARHAEHSVAGPALRENDEGTLTLTFDASGPVWDQKLTNRSRWQGRRMR